MVESYRKDNTTAILAGSLVLSDSLSLPSVKDCSAVQNVFEVVKSSYPNITSTRDDDVEDTWRIEGLDPEKGLSTIWTFHWKSLNDFLEKIVSSSPLFITVWHAVENAFEFNPQYFKNPWIPYNNPWHEGNYLSVQLLVMISLRHCALIMLQESFESLEDSDCQDLEIVSTTQLPVDQLIKNAKDFIIELSGDVIYPDLEASAVKYFRSLSFLDKENVNICDLSSYIYNTLRSELLEDTDVEFPCEDNLLSASNVEEASELDFDNLLKNVCGLKMEKLYHLSDNSLFLPIDFTDFFSFLSFSKARQAMNADEASPISIVYSIKDLFTSFFALQVTDEFPVTNFVDEISYQWREHVVSLLTSKLLDFFRALDDNVPTFLGFWAVISKSVKLAPPAIDHPSVLLEDLILLRNRVLFDESLLSELKESDLSSLSLSSDYSLDPDVLSLACALESEFLLSKKCGDLSTTSRHNMTASECGNLVYKVLCERYKIFINNCLTNGSSVSEPISIVASTRHRQPSMGVDLGIISLKEEMYVDSINEANNSKLRKLTDQLQEKEKKIQEFYDTEFRFAQEKNSLQKQILEVREELKKS
eukprot:GHVP01018675.1.p1 GENE.GHVP01018675.1~~GHVP01018675.1.p1  ORF type:complete len:589 (-),score=99.87 GHVP01018675.1:1004-2770(-)